MDNYKKSERGGVRVQAPLVDRVVTTDLTSDFSLPDYCPEIKRLLRVRACVMPVEHYVGVGNAEMSGKVEYSVLYAGHDGGLYCVTHGEDLAFSVPVEMTSDFELGDGLVCDVQSLCESASGRVAAPRRLALKCRVRSRVRILGTLVLSEPLSAAEDMGIERLCGFALCGSHFVGVSEPITLGDEILYDGSDLRVISAEGQVFVTETTAGSGVVNCSGEIALKLLCVQEGDGEMPTVHNRRLPFSTAVAVDRAEVNCDASATGVCSEIGVTVEEGRLLCEVTFLLEARAERNESVAYTRDLYSTGAECRTTKTELRLPRALRCINANFSLNQMLTLEELGIRAGASVADLSVTPTLQELSSERGKYVLSGRCRCHAVLFDGEEYAAQEFELPFRFETEGGADAVVDHDASLSVISCRARMDGERIGIDAELAVSLITRGEEVFCPINDAVLGDAVSRTGGAFTICYPAREDTLWSVAKRYHKTVASIAEINTLAGAPRADSAESLAGVKYLLV